MVEEYTEQDIRNLEKAISRLHVGGGAVPIMPKKNII